MKTLGIPAGIMAIFLSWPSPATALPTPEEEQANGFFVRAQAAEKRGDIEIARICYGLALRAQTSHREAQERFKALSRKESDLILRKGTEAEAKGDLKNANLHYAMAFEADPSSGEATTKLKELEKKMGADFLTAGRARILQKMDSIIIPRIDFVDTSLVEAVNFLRLRSAELDIATSDPAKKGINFVIRNAPTGDNPGALRIRELRVRNAPLAVALKYICDQTKARTLVDETGVTFVMADGPAGKPVTPSQVAPASTNRPGPVAPSGPLVWKSKDGKSVGGDFIGLDGEAVVIKRDGKEFTIPFNRLDAASVSQARDLEAIRSDVVLHYDFSDGAGTTVKDRSGKSRDGTLVGFANTEPGSGDSGAVSGWSKDGHLMFDGVDDKIVTPLMVSDLAGGGLTVEAVVSHKNVDSTFSVVVGTDASDFRTGGVVQLCKAGKGNWRCPGSGIAWRLNGLKPANGNSTGPTSIGDGRLHHIAVVYDAVAETVSLYCDHHLRSQQSGVSGRLAGNNRILLGATGWKAEEAWFGPISEIRITKRPLQTSQFLPDPNPSTILPPVPKHRWSFSGDLNDSLGGAHGTIIDAGQPGAKFADGQLDLSSNKGERSGSLTNDAFVDLPNGLVAGLKGRVSFEMWCTQTSWTTHANAFRFDRHHVEGEAVRARTDDYAAIALQPRCFGYDLHGILDVGAKGWYANSHFDVPAGTERHYVFVLDPGDPASGPGGTQTLYLDGYRVASGAMPPGFLDSYGDNNNWLARGSGGDPMFSGRYNEFRLYDKALTPHEVLASYLAGPDAKLETPASPKR